MRQIAIKVGSETKGTRMSVGERTGVRETFECQ